MVAIAAAMTTAVTLALSIFDSYLSLSLFWILSDVTRNCLPQHRERDFRDEVEDARAGVTVAVAAIVGSWRRCGRCPERHCRLSDRAGYAVTCGEVTAAGAQQAGPGTIKVRYALVQRERGPAKSPIAVNPGGPGGSRSTTQRRSSKVWTVRCTTTTCW